MREMSQQMLPRITIKLGSWLVFVQRGHLFVLLSIVVMFDCCLQKACSSISDNMDFQPFVGIPNLMGSILKCKFYTHSQIIYTSSLNLANQSFYSIVFMTFSSCF